MANPSAFFRPRIGVVALVACLCLDGTGCNNNGAVAENANNATYGAGTVSLPPGVPLSLNSLSVETSSGAAGVSAQGAFQCPSTVGPALALVEDASGDVVMMGFVDSSANGNSIGPLETSETLLFFALGGFLVPAQVWPSIISSLAEEGATKDLAIAFASILASHPSAIQDGDPALTMALQAAQSALTPMRSVPKTSWTPPKTSQFLSLPLGPPAVSLLTDPGGGVVQSGAQLVQGDLAGTLQIINNDRRHAEFLLYETAFTTVDSDGNASVNPLAQASLITPPNPPADDKGNLLLNSTQSLSSLIGVMSQIVNLYLNNANANPGNVGNVPTTAFVPTITAPWSLSLDATADTTQTSFTGVTVGGSFNWSFPDPLDQSTWTPTVIPPLASDPRFASFAPKWYSDGQVIASNSFLFDLIFPLINTAASAGGLASPDPPSFSLLDPIDTYVSEIQNVPGALDDLSAEYNGVFGTNVNFGSYAPGNTTIPTTAIRAIILNKAWSQAAKFFLSTLAKSSAGRAVLENVALGGLSQQADAFVAKFAAANGIMTAVNVLLGVSDLATVVKDMTSSDVVDTWSVEAIKPKVFLKPPTTTIDLGHLTDPANTFVTLVASSPATGSLETLEANQSAVSYHWSLTGNAGGLLLSLNQGGQYVNGTSFDSTASSVQYQTGGSISPNDPTNGQVDTVTVQIYLLTPSQGGGQGVKTLIGKQSATITMHADAVTLKVTPSVLLPGQQATAEADLLDTSFVGSAIFSGFGFAASPTSVAVSKGQALLGLTAPQSMLYGGKGTVSVQIQGQATQSVPVYVNCSGTIHSDPGWISGCGQITASDVVAPGQLQVTVSNVGGQCSPTMICASDATSVAKVSWNTTWAVTSTPSLYNYNVGYSAYPVPDTPICVRIPVGTADSSYQVTFGYDTTVAPRCTQDTAVAGQTAVAGAAAWVSGSYPGSEYGWSSLAMFRISHAK